MIKMKIQKPKGFYQMDELNIFFDLIKSKEEESAEIIDLSDKTDI